MSGYSTRNRLIKQVFNENVDTWGDPVLNSQAIDMIDEALDKSTTVTSTGGTDTLTSLNGSTDQSRCRILKITGALVSSHTINLPANEKWYMVRNLHTGAFTTTMGVIAGTYATVLQRPLSFLYCDGTITTDITDAVNDFGPATGNLSMGSFKITTMADGTNTNDAVNFGQLLAYFSSGSPGLLGLQYWRPGIFR